MKDPKSILKNINQKKMNIEIRPCFTTQSFIRETMWNQKKKKEKEKKCDIAK